MLHWLLKKFLGSDHERELQRIRPVVDRIGALESDVARKTDAEIREAYARLRERHRPEGKEGDGGGEDLVALLPEAFALTREAARRAIGLRHYDVQLIGGCVLFEGNIAEMKTGEGKTLVATLPLALEALSGRGAHLVTVNDYLARRDSEWMGPVYRALGLTVGVIQHDQPPPARRAAYACDITYGTNNEFGFDYLRDNMVIHTESKVQRGHAFAIVDEVDSILIDESRTPLIISGPAEESPSLYLQINRLMPRFFQGGDFEIDEKDRVITLTDAGMAKAESLLGQGNLYDPHNIHLTHHILQGLRAHHLYKRDVEYVVQEGEVVIVDEFTGRLMPGRRWSDGLHQAVEAKEGQRIKEETQTYATITFQNFFRMYGKLAGMTGTAETEAAEFREIYRLPVLPVPPNLPMNRLDHPDSVYNTEREKNVAVVEETSECYERGQPVLMGTITIEKSEHLSELLRKRGIPHQVLNAKHHAREAEIVAQAGRLKSVTIATNMAGRGTDILLGGNPEAMARLRAAGDPEKFAAEFEKAKSECAKEHEEVVALGGLHIIGTERHESRRIDNQLRGRSGRQGDPGSARFYLSLEDDLMRLFGGGNVQKMMNKMNWEEGEPIIHPLVTKAIGNAQKKVEMMNFDRRKRLLEYDDVMNAQRKVVYELRDRILHDADLAPLIAEFSAATLDWFLDEDAPAGKEADAWDLPHLVDALTRVFDVRIAPETLAGSEMTREHLREILLGEITGHIARRGEIFGPEVFADLTKQIFLHVLDVRWKDHLTQMDALREGIGWRGVGQRDPLVEYKKESFDLFLGLVDSCKEESLRLLVRVQPATDHPGAPPPRRRISAPTGAAPAPVTVAKEGATPRASADAEPAGAKIGRNDPCPCGSGKKYKKCHGK